MNETNLMQELRQPHWVMNRLQEWYASAGLGTQAQDILVAVTAMTLVVILSVAAIYLARVVLLKLVQRLVTKSRSKWDDALLRWRVFHRLAHLAPGLVLYYLAPVALSHYPTWAVFVSHLTLIYILFVGLMVIDAALNAFSGFYESLAISKEIPLKGFVQVVKIILYFVSGILALAIALQKNPAYLLSGMGALTAILMLIFKDPILGFVAGIQLTSNRMVAVGDWIEMPKYGANGDVMEVALTTVKVRNWDKTITTIPTYALISDSFKNWRGMTESGGRRIKRSINLDMQSIRFCTEEMLQRYSRIAYITEYLERKKKELQEYNTSRKVDLATLANGRRLTNIGTFRAYVMAYLKDHPQIHQDMTFLVRQLAPTEHGLPIEIYVFSKDQAWVNYEGIQSDIFDHILAVIPEFDLRVYQSPAGSDFRRWVEGEALLKSENDNRS